MGEGRFRIERLPAGRGLAWLTAALELLRRQPFRLLLFGLVLQFLAGLTQAGALGILFVLSVPALTAGILRAFYTVDSGQRPPLIMLFSAFGSPERLLRLVLLGGLMLAGAIAAVMLVLSGTVAGMEPDTLARLEQGDVEALLAVDPQILERLMFALIAGLLISGTLSYFAVPLITFMDVPLGRAIAAGLSGMLRNWRPFLVLGLFLAVLAVPVAVLSALVLGLSATGSGISPLLTLLMLLAAVIYQMIVFATQYAAFREIFGLQPPNRQPPEDGGQLVA
jgi:hypothetical protein